MADSIIPTLFEVAAGNDQARQAVLDKFARAAESAPASLVDFLRGSPAPHATPNLPDQLNKE